MEISDYKSTCCHADILLRKDGKGSICSNCNRSHNHITITTMKHQYYKVKKDRQDYKGNRYFKFSPDSEKVIQVCVHPGEEKKGRTNSYGVYLIHRLTFLTNYFLGFESYVELCTKKEYEKAFNQIVEALK